MKTNNSCPSKPPDASSSQTTSAIRFLRKADLKKLTLSNSSGPFDDTRAIAHLQSILPDLEKRENAIIKSLMFG